MNTILFLVILLAILYVIGRSGIFNIIWQILKGFVSIALALLLLLLIIGCVMFACGELNF